PLRGIASLPAERNVGYGRGTMRPDPPDPPRMRQAMADFVAAVHEPYLPQPRLLPPAGRARLPVRQAPELRVAAAGARNLHVIGTGERFPGPVGQEVEVAGEADGLTWRARFFDPGVR